MTFPILASERTGKRVIKTLGLLLFVVVLVRTAWLCDDAFIAFRTAHNFVLGYGLRWNVAERVQTYTCPLWLLSFAALHAVTREVTYTSLALSAVFSIGAVLLLLWRARTPAAAAFAGAAVISSKSFTDYSTSGLENPLTHLLVAAFLVVYFSNGLKRRVLILSLLTSLAAVNRLDILLLLLPPLAWAAWANGRIWPALRAVALGMLPLLAWEVFSLIYYGFLFPNTAYAKLSTGTPAGELAMQGLRYYAGSLRLDYVTIPCILWGLTIAFAVRRARATAIAVAIGIIAYLLYIVKIGGDFMSGRFFSAAFLAAVFLGVEFAAVVKPSTLTAVALAIFAAGLVPQSSPLRSGSDYGADAFPWRLEDCYCGICDERSAYFLELGLFHDRPPRRGSIGDWQEEGERVAQNLRDPRWRAWAAPNVGVLAYSAGPDAWIIDTMALCDPLLARLPAVEDKHWRVGHFMRAVPEGYQETCASGSNQIRDRQLADFDDSLRRIVSGPLFSADRWREIVNMNLGRLDGYIDAEYYRHPTTLRLRRAVEVAKPPPSARSDK